MQVNRWYVRCLHCLSIAAVTEAPSTHDTLCAVCDGPIEIMGRVEQNSLVRDEYRPPCDDRCTNAKGPLCECHCGGENHGSRRIVHIVRDAGPVPRVRFPDTWRARENARDYRAARDAARAELDPLIDRRRAGFLPRSDFDRLRILQDALHKAREARSHDNRMRTLRAVVAPPPSPIADFAAALNPTSGALAIDPPPFSLSAPIAQTRGHQPWLFNGTE